MRIIGIPQLTKNLDAYLNKKKTQLTGVVAHSAREVETAAKHNAPRDTGDLRSGINHLVMHRATEIIGRITSNASYSAPVEFGSRPHFPPPHALAGWAARHGMAGAEYAIAKKIAERGTPEQPYMAPAFAKVKKKFIKDIKKVMRSL